ncbi:hypothetical protein G6F43_009689 [Rhizopus delemar]|nr:hypothetical protein G6F43_009689 [Rhizopus delemar]
MFEQSQLRPSIPAAVAPHSEAVHRILQGEQPTAHAFSLLQGISSAAMSAAPTEKNPIQEVKSTRMMEALVADYQAVVVMFTSPTCEPCQTIKPKLKELMQEKNNQPAGKIRVLAVLLDMSTALGSQHYNIRGMPAFFFFFCWKLLANK